MKRDASLTAEAPGRGGTVPPHWRGQEGVPSAGEDGAVPPRYLALHECRVFPAAKLRSVLAGPRSHPESRTRHRERTQDVTGHASSRMTLRASRRCTADALGTHLHTLFRPPPARTALCTRTGSCPWCSGTGPTGGRGAVPRLHTRSRLHKAHGAQAPPPPPAPCGVPSPAPVLTLGATQAPQTAA